jgi:DNA-binding NtrC family response regulator
MDEIPAGEALRPQPTKITYVDGRAATITLRRCQLEAQRGDGVYRKIFDGDVITVGGTGDNDFIIEDETVSRHHCRIFVEGGHYMVKDLDSTNGTFVNRTRVREAWLSAGCTIRVGKSEVRFTPFDEKLEVVPSERESFGGLIGSDPTMREVYTILEKISPTDTTVIIEGETGTGKEVVARAIHDASRRGRKPFIVFDCGAVPEKLIESELFGHEKGAFTGAISTRKGVFEMADGGTVFLDELGELALDLQPRLLRVLEQREVKRVGGLRPQRVDVRVVAATNRDLQTEVREGRFREDLFYRLSVVRVRLPPLRDRRTDIQVLVDHFLRKSRFNQVGNGSIRVHGVADNAMERLLAHDWPGNVRELVNAVERAVSFADGEVIELQDLPEHISGTPYFAGAWDATTVGTSNSSPPPPLARTADVNGTFKDAKEQWVASFERDYIEELLKRNSGNISHAAREAEIDRKYFRKLMKKYGIEAS